MLVRIANKEDTYRTASSPPICLHDISLIALWSSGADPGFQNRVFVGMKVRGVALLILSHFSYH